MTTKPRMHYFDTIKGIAIFLVVTGHVLTMCIRDIDQAFLFKFIGEVHMPIFFFISGFFSYKHNDKEAFTQPDLKQRFKQLIIPFIVVGMLWIWYFPHSSLNSPINASFEGFWLDAYKNGYWFTLCLFEIIAIYGATSVILKRLDSFLLQVIVLLTVWGLIGLTTFIILPGNAVSVLSLVPVFQFYPIFMAGVMARKHQEKFMQAVNNDKILTINILIAAPAIYYICYFWEFDFIPAQCTYAVRCILHIALACIAINAAKYWHENTGQSNVAIKVLSYSGKQSLAIYLLHYFMLFPLTFLQEPLRRMGLGLVPTFAVAAVTASAIISMTLLINYIISRSKLLSLLLTGKS